MSCANPLKMVSSLLDGGMTTAEQEKALAHLKSCGTCNARFQSAYHLRQSLLQMDQPPMPEPLMGRLRVLASHERERRLRYASPSAFIRHWAACVRLSFDNMMRPRALPVAGGVISALLLVGVWFPARAAKQTADDVPLSTWGYIGPSPLDVRATGAAGDAVVELTIDERGRVVDYIVTSGKMTPELGSMILFSRFNPATLFGRPTSGKLVYRLSQISVIG
jgi:hypothetical protein